MTPQTPDMRAVLERLEKIEKQNRWLKRTVAVATTVVGAIALMGPSAPRPETRIITGKPDVIYAHKFGLTDEAGRIRAALAMSAEGPTLTLFSDHGVARATLVASADGPRLQLADAKGFTRTALYVAEVSTGRASKLPKEAQLRTVIPIPGWAVSADQPGGPPQPAEVGASLDFYEPKRGTVGMVRADSGIGIIGLAGSSPEGQQSSSVSLRAEYDTSWVRLQDQEGFKAYLGTAQVESESTGKSERTSAASIALFSRNAMLWRVP
jgi:hypothetical protein